MSSATEHEPRRADLPADAASDRAELAPYPGSHAMPRWDVGELPRPPVFRARNWATLIGPGLVMGAAAIGGGEWLTGPLTTAKYGGSILWLATLSILGQVVYNIEISRYTLYSGEPIFTGKFRVPPGPMFWLFLYLLLDFGSILPYLASNAAVPLFALIKSRLPVFVEKPGIDPGLVASDVLFVKALGCAVFLGVLLPLVVGGKVYNSLKAVMTFKLIVVVGFLLFLAVGYSTADTWAEIFGGFFKFGSVPVNAKTADGPRTANIFLALFRGEPIPTLDLSMVAILAGMAAISGNGGLTNTPVSSFTRDQGWGMGYHVGAIPSIVGGHTIELSHVGMVFRVTKESMQRWRGWLRHVQREQLAVWMPACFLGVALPSMLSVQFLPRGTDLKDKWLAAGMTAQGVSDAVGPTLGPAFWHLTLFCGFLVLATSMATTADGFLRRWVDVAWTASPRMREWDTKDIGRFYFLVLCAYAALGLVFLTLIPGDGLLRWTTTFYNYALGFSCFHVLVINTLLLPRELRPGVFRRVGLVLAGLFFTAIAILATMDTFKLGPFAPKEAPAASAKS